MAFSGKIRANNHTHLLELITNWITGDPNTPGRDWTVLRDDSQTWGTSRVFKNTGLSGTEQVYVGLYVATHSDNVKGGLICKVYKYFDGSPTSEGGSSFFDTIYGNGNGNSAKDTLSFVPCWNAGMDVWIWSSKARIVLVVGCNAIYASAYLGQLLRLCLPSENPWPLACFTDGFTNLWGTTTWHDSATLPSATSPSDAGRRSIAFVRRGSQISGYTNRHACHQVCRADGVWTPAFVVIPTTSRGNSASMESSLEMDTIPVSFPAEASRVLMPLYVKTLDNQILGQMDGVFWCPDMLSTLESLVDGATVFPDVNRIEWHSFMAVGE